MGHLTGLSVIGRDISTKESGIDALISRGIGRQHVVDALENKGVNPVPTSESVELMDILSIMHEPGFTFDTHLGHVYVTDLILSKDENARNGQQYAKTR
jgi:hypothetical protein